MGIEINLDKLKKLNFQAENEVSLKAVPVEIEIGAEFNGVTEGYSDKAEFSRKKTDAPKNAEEKIAKNIKDKLKNEDDLRPGESLKAYLDKNISEPELRAEADKYIEKLDGMKNEPEKYLKEYKKAKDKPLYKELVEVYIKEERAQAYIDFHKFLTTAAATKKEDGSENSYTEMLNAYEAGWYFDENGQMKRDKNRMNPYREEALYNYTVDDMPFQMEKRFQTALLEIEKEGTLQNYKSDNELAKAVMEKAGIDGSDPKFEQYVKNRKAIAKLTERHDKVMKRREELKKVSMDEIEKKLKKETIASIKDYMEANKNKDGSYDLSEISVVIEGRIGKDYYVNRFDSDATLWEVNQVRKELRAARKDANGNKYHIVDKSSFDPEKTDSKQTKDLIDFCGYEFEPKNHVPSIIEAAKGLAEGAIGGLLVHIAAPQRSRLYVEQTVILQDILNSMSLADVAHILGGNAGAAQINGASIIVQQIVDKNVLWDNVLPAIGDGALWGILAHAATDAIFGRGFDEKECFDKSDYNVDKSRYTIKADFEEFLKDSEESHTDYDKVKKYLDKYPAKEDGTWDHAHFFNDLRKDAGLGSNLNCLEMAGAEMYGDVKQEPQKAEYIAAERTVLKYVEYDYEEKTEPVNEEKPNENTFSKYAKNSSWGHIVNNIYGCDGPTLMDIFDTPKTGDTRSRRVIKLVQCIKNEDYSYENIKKLLDMSYNGGLEQFADPTNKEFNYQEYLNYRDSWKMPEKLKLPKEIAGVKLCDMSDESVLIAPKCNDTPQGSDKAGTPQFSQTDGQTKQKKGQRLDRFEQEYYSYDVNTGKEKTYKDKTARDIDYKAWKKEHPNGTYTDFQNNLKGYKDGKEQK